MKKNIFMAIVFIVCLIFPCYSNEINFSISELESFLGKSVPNNAERLDIDLWSIILFDNGEFGQFVRLTTRNRIVIAAEYIFVSGSVGSLSSLRGKIIDFMEEFANNRVINNNNIIWKLNPDSGLDNNKHLFAILYPVVITNSIKGLYDLTFGIMEYQFIQGERQ